MHGLAWSDSKRYHEECNDDGITEVEMAKEKREGEGENERDNERETWRLFRDIIFIT